MIFIFEKQFNTRQSNNAKYYMYATMCELVFTLRWCCSWFAFCIFLQQIVLSISPIRRNDYYWCIPFFRRIIIIYYDNFVSVSYCIHRILKLKWYEFMNCIARSIRSIRLSWNQLNIEMLRFIFFSPSCLKCKIRNEFKLWILLFAILFYCRYQLFISSGHPWWNICTT